MNNTFAFRKLLPASTKLIVALILITGSQTLVAETVYIRDTLYVPLRTGPSPEYRIVQPGLRSGTPLELVEADEEHGWVRVRMNDGTEGWVEDQYVQEERIARDRLEAARNRVIDLEAKHQQALLRIQELEDANRKLKSMNEELRNANERLSNELDALTQKAENVIVIDAENSELRQENEGLQDQLEEVRLANEDLQDNSRQEWFLRGAGVILLGLLFGFWVGRRIYHHRGGGWWA